MPNWIDKWGDGCEWYQTWDVEGCPNYGTFVGGNGGVPANEGCCFCRGGTTTTGVAPCTSPPSSHTAGTTPSLDCIDMINWKDVNGDGCEWYQYYDDEGCPDYGTLWDGGHGVPNEGCCWCGGGTTTAVAPSTSPSTSPTTSLTTFLSLECFDLPNWKDKCELYALLYDEECFQFGEVIHHDPKGTYNEGCCFLCGGGTTSPTSISP